MTDLLQQQRAQEFSLSMFASIGNAVTSHFLRVLESSLADKKVELSGSSQTQEEKEAEMDKFGMLVTQNAHILIRRHTALIVGGFTADMFPGLMPEPPKEEAPKEETSEVPEDVEENVQVFGVAGVPSSERVMQ